MRKRKLGGQAIRPTMVLWNGWPAGSHYTPRNALNQELCEGHTVVEFFELEGPEGRHCTCRLHATDVSTTADVNLFFKYLKKKICQACALPCGFNLFVY